ncbi:cysteine desulfurase family protein [Desulfuromonas sp. AOP6]|uniref:cysteine desulfurase family protein n=1 Tax=Desulfuromonas sp. AOP6 TaxID=1566351 RepID=UPI001282FB8F|nr:cysteine desulfurase family protein [Desulfuromonas sp. AOP6]BCA81007.1 cysteine desulfurase IscS [Desulfuromonas sp. AOP6]
MNNSEILYFDYQATTPVADEILNEMLPYFSDSFANPHSADHVLGYKSSAAIEKAAQQIANFIGADSDEIIFTSGATESNNLALLGLAKGSALKGSSRKRILMSEIEHKSVLSVGPVLEQQYGFTVETIPVDRNGYIVATEMERLLEEDVLLVSIMAVNNEIGTIQNIDTLSKIIRPHKAVFHCDASQAPMGINMNNFVKHVDMLSLSGHKMYGPKGIGALYICRDLQDQIEPLIYGGNQQNGLRPGTLPTPLCVGLGAAAEYLGSPQAALKRDNLRSRRDRFVAMLLALPWSAKLYGADCQKRHPGNISIGFKGVNGQDILGVLQPYLAASSGSACTSGIPEPSHVLRAIGLNKEEADSAVRLSLGFETSDQQIDEAIKLIDMALRKLSESSSFSM